MEILRDLRLGKYDVLIGINLLREGLDLPEVSLIAILDADKEGFLRSETSLIQTIGRAARNANGHVILYGDHETDSMKAAMEETERRRKIQQAYNEEHGIIPTTIQKEIHAAISTEIAAEELKDYADDAPVPEKEEISKEDLQEMIVNMDVEMRRAAEELDFERAASIRDAIRAMKKEYGLS